MTSLMIKFVAVLILGLFSVVSVAAAGPEIGTTATVKPGEPVPTAPDGLMWMVQGHIQNMTMTIPGMPLVPRGPILQVKLVQMNRENAGERFKSTEVGGFLPPSDSFFQWRLASDEQGRQQLEMYQKFVALLTDRFIVDQTTRSVRDHNKLPALPIGYQWEAQSRVSGVGTLIPDLDEGDFRPSADLVTYVLKKDRTDLPNQFEQSRVVSGFAKSESEFRSGLTCRPAFTGGR
jgi:hypothetical protein